MSQHQLMLHPTSNKILQPSETTFTIFKSNDHNIQKQCSQHQKIMHRKTQKEKTHPPAAHLLLQHTTMLPATSFIVCNITTSAVSLQHDKRMLTKSKNIVCNILKNNVVLVLFTSLSLKTSINKACNI